LFNFDVKELSDCGGAIAIVKAVLAVDEDACVYVRIATHCVEVTSRAFGAREFLSAISGAGFAAALVPAEERLLPQGYGKFPRRIVPKIAFQPDGTEFDSGDA